MADISEGIKQISGSSETIEKWALAIIGGTILIIVSTSYARPENSYMRLTYLLFVIGWILVGLSMYYGNLVRRNIMAWMLVKDEFKRDTFRQLTINFQSQIDFFQYGLGVFGIWLVIYLMWWVFGNAK